MNNHHTSDKWVCRLPASVEGFDKFKKLVETFDLFNVQLKRYYRCPCVYYGMDEPSYESHAVNGQCRKADAAYFDVYTVKYPLRQDEIRALVEMTL